jgi:hypothetical protein
MNQPGVYWLLNAPFVDIVALYSNAAENPGFISGAIPGSAQKTWLIRTLKGISAQRKAKPQERKALIFATHHPPYTAGGHSPSTEMLADIDDACKQGGVMPDMFLSGHAHSYQRYTRDLTFNGRALQIPYLVAGTGGINDQAVHSAAGKPRTGDHTFESSLQGYGYLLIEANSTTLTATMFQVDVQSPTIPKKKSQYDRVSVDLAHGKVG